jgi:D-alanyl-lipoteichoic acid acyltransferase DltB (MBOAT superfamily)
MLFNSYQYLIFLPTVFVLYWLAGKNRLTLQNVILLLASYVFYGWWDYRFLSLIVFSTLIDYWAALQMISLPDKKSRKFYLLVSIFVNLGTLFLFKYYNFFLHSLLEISGMRASDTLLFSVVLPVGISFYTFQTMSYSIDVYFGKIKPTQSFLSFATYVAFFPQLVAGPIEKAQHLLPQILRNRVFNQSQCYSGLKLILWGLFKKVVVADSLAPRVERIFHDNGLADPGSLWLGAFFFAIQIYGDFSGYSDIAIGSAKLFGFELMSNFRFPFFSRNFVEFWQRWHVSLNNWFRSYLYTYLVNKNPKKGILQTTKNTFILFVTSGLWHGANWTYVVWGVVSWMLFVPTYLKTRFSTLKKGDLGLVGWKDLPSVLLTFSLFAWSSIFFRSQSMKDAILYNIRMFSSTPHFSFLHNSVLFYIAVLFIMEWMHRANEREPLSFPNKWIEYWVILMIFLFTFINFGKNPQEFIYFSF